MYSTVTCYSASIQITDCGLSDLPQISAESYTPSHLQQFSK